MKNQPRPVTLQSTTESPARCPFRWSCKHGKLDDTSPLYDVLSDTRYVQARRQGIYLAACIIDEVASLGAPSPEAVIDEIRRRICDLVRVELIGPAGE
jgi:hypothetical protein